MPLVLSGTLAFGTMGVPLSAYAIDVNEYDEMTEAEIFEAELAERVAFEDGFTQEMADELLAEYYLQVEEENALALAALEEEEKAAAEKAAAEKAAAEQAAAEQAAAEQAAAAQASQFAEAAADAAADAKAASGKHAAAQSGAAAGTTATDADKAGQTEQVADCDKAADGETAGQDAAGEQAAGQGTAPVFVMTDNAGETVQVGADGQPQDGAPGEGTPGTTGAGDTTGTGTTGDTGTGTTEPGDATQGETPDKTFDANKTADDIRSFLGADEATEAGIADLADALASTGKLAPGESTEFTFSYVYQGISSSRTFTAVAQEDGTIQIIDSLSGSVVTTVKATDPAAPTDPAATDDAEAEKQATEKAMQGKHAKTFEDTLGVDVATFQKAAVKYNEDLQKKAEDGVSGFGEGYPSAYAGSNSGYTRVKYTSNLTTSMFIASIGEQARQICQEKHLYASVMIAQAIVESDSGNSGLARDPYNNLFGIKGSYKGNSVTMATQEDNGSGALYDINAAFRSYKTKAESMEDYADLLRSDMGHYYNAWKENAKTYKDAAKALQGTYATSTIYADTLCAVIEAYDLTRFDKPLDFEIVGKDAKGHKLTMDDYAALEANAVSFLGTPYVWGGTTPDGFDCSGFVQYLYKQTFGIELPRTTYTQQYEGKEVSFKDLQMGDLLFFDEGGSTEHVAMYLGDGFYIHAPEPGDSIKITDMESFTPTFAKRIIKTQKVKDAKADSKKVEKAQKAQKAEEFEKAPKAATVGDAEADAQAGDAVVDEQVEAVVEDAVELIEEGVEASAEL